MKSHKLVIIGNTSNAKLAHFYFQNDSVYDVVAFSVNREYISEGFFCGLPVIPLEEIETTYPPDMFDVFIAVGYSGMNKIRENLYTKCKELGYRMPNYISSRSSFLTKETIGDNNLILEDNTIQPFVKIGSNNVLWSGNHIGHDSVIGDHCFITSHVVVSGFVRIKNNCFLGVNSTLRDAIVVERESLIGAGAVIMKDTVEKGVYLPAKTVLLDKRSDEIQIS